MLCYILQQIQQCKARYSYTLNSGYRCDACQKSTNHVRYRCLECPDVDICVQCFDVGNIPSAGSHTGDHDLVMFWSVSQFSDLLPHLSSVGWLPTCKRRLKAVLFARSFPDSSGRIWHFVYCHLRCSHVLLAFLLCCCKVSLQSLTLRHLNQSIL